MDVKLIAHTAMTDEGYALMDSWDWIQERVEPEDNDRIVEVGGRACYQSWDHPNPKTATNYDYVRNVIQQQHESVLEHSTATFYITGISRSLTHELIRHRHLSPSQQSQRYVDESDAAFILPPLMRDLREKYGTDTGLTALDNPEAYEAIKSINYMIELAARARDLYEDFVLATARLGVKRKQAREAARAILPNGTETRIVLTGNLRAWRHMIKLRNTPAADAEIRELAGHILRHLRTIAPNSMSDIPEDDHA